MANGYDPGDYLGQFLKQLPAIYANQQNQRLAEERLNLQRQSAQQQQEYRTQLESRAKETQEYNLFNQLYTSLDGNQEAQNLLVQQHPIMKDNPNLQEAFVEGNQNKDAMKSTVYGFASKPPEVGILEARKALNSPYMTKELYETTQKYIKDATDELRFTMDDFKGTEAAIEWASELDKFENPMKYLPANTPPEEYEAFMSTVTRRLTDIKQEGEEEYRAGFATYPTYNNIEGVPDNEIDKLLTDFTTPFTERYPFTNTTTDTTGTQIQTAGPGLSTKVGPGSAVIAPKTQPPIIGTGPGGAIKK